MQNPQNLDWEKLYLDNVSTYKKGRPKRAEFIISHLKQINLLDEIESFLEEGAFSAKDLSYLAKNLSKKIFVATDLNELSMVNRKTENILNCAADAFNLPFRDRHFGVTFHSGLIIYFNNSDAIKIIQEQTRVTKSIAYIFAHNKHNYLDTLISNGKCIMGNRLFSFRRYSKGELIEIGTAIGCPFEIVPHDNMLENFSQRNCRWLLPVIQKLGLHKSLFFANELTLIIKP
ncbi:class I SAM-dependent methyltransferase [Pseudomonas sp. 273]|uniref:class I SAM-dependent methyltransferase n=1 Tax=Pseudomonas sp. 273 TaxID=75692 RepID=UPI0023D8389D|nr:class I SAM-dependent methyltransferase [Pseudomonas sp. 273]